MATTLEDMHHSPDPVCLFAKETLFGLVCIPAVHALSMSAANLRPIEKGNYATAVQLGENGCTECLACRRILYIAGPSIAAVAQDQFSSPPRFTNTE